MQPPSGGKIRVSCNESFVTHEEETQDLEGKNDKNQLITKDTAAFARKDTLLQEIK